ncbi:MAG: hypothetical protein II971_02615 [Firmicutes bacterium]|nr:hypothetical protein [Bacillota bacterium]
MFRKMGYAIFCVLVIVIAMAMQYNTTETRKLNTQLSEMNDKVAEAQAELAEKEQTLEALQSRLAELEAEAEAESAEQAGSDEDAESGTADSTDAPAYGTAANEGKEAL